MFEIAEWGGRKVLITGGAGFVGGHLARSLQGDAEIRVLDDLSTGSRENLRWLKVDLHVGSILDEGMLAEAVRGVDVVFHLAAMADVAQSVRNPSLCHELNATGTLRVLEASAAAGVRRLIFASSAAVYGNEAGAPQREDMRLCPESPYGISKLTAEHYCRYFRAAAGMETVVLRFFNIFGGNRRSATALPVVENFITSALRGAPLVIHGDGRQSRDFIHVGDIVAAARWAAEMKDPGPVYNVGGGSSISIRTLADRIVKLAGSDSGIVHLPGRLGDIRHSQASLERLQAAGFRVQTGFEKGILATLDLFRVSIA